MKTLAWPFAAAILLVAATCATLVGCATPIPAGPVEIPPDTACLEGGNHFGVSISILEIDGLTTDGEEPYCFPAGIHRVGVRAVGGNQQVQEYVDLNLAGGRQFALRAQLSGISFMFELADITDRVDHRVASFSLRGGYLGVPVAPVVYYESWYWGGGGYGRPYARRPPPPAQPTPRTLAVQPGPVAAGPAPRPPAVKESGGWPSRELPSAAGGRFWHCRTNNGRTECRGPERHRQSEQREWTGGETRATTPSKGWTHSRSISTEGGDPSTIYPPTGSGSPDRRERLDSYPSKGRQSVRYGVPPAAVAVPAPTVATPAPSTGDPGRSANWQNWGGDSGSGSASDSSSSPWSHRQRKPTFGGSSSDSRGSVPSYSPSPAPAPFYSPPAPSSPPTSSGSSDSDAQKRRREEPVASPPESAPPPDPAPTPTPVQIPTPAPPQPIPLPSAEGNQG